MERAAPGETSRETLERQIADQGRWIRLLDAQIRLLERERQKLSAVVNHADAGFLVLDMHLRVTWASDFFAKRLREGAHAAELCGRACHEVLCRESARCQNCPAALVFDSRGVAHLELPSTLGGRTRHLYATAMPIRSPRGDVDAAMVMVQDVSDLEVLRRSNGRTELLLSQMPAILWTTDVDLRITSSAGAGLAGLGLRQGEVVGRTLFAYFGGRPGPSHRRPPSALAGSSVPSRRVAGAVFTCTGAAPGRRATSSAPWAPPSTSPSARGGGTSPRRATLREREGSSSSRRRWRPWHAGAGRPLQQHPDGILGYAALLKRRPPRRPRAQAAEIIEGGGSAGRAHPALLGFARRGKNQTVPVDLGEPARGGALLGAPWTRHPPRPPGPGTLRRRRPRPDQQVI
jgi:PAS domain-containing protein